MSEILATNGTPILIDEELYPLLSYYSWWIDENGYAQTTICGRRITMQRFILNLDKGVADHKNGNRLDNRLSNLRNASIGQNAYNTRITSRNTSGFKGVHFDKKRNRWCAKITYNKKTKHLGYYSDPKDAAKAYNLAAIEHHGEFAVLNVVE